MSVRVDVRYEGELHCVATHEPSGDPLPTDAPKDNQGRGAHYSPTDLVAAALGTCMLTTMAIAGRRREIELGRASAVVHKEMGAEPRRHISKLRVELTLPEGLDTEARTYFERIARTCPVAESLGSATEIELSLS